MNSFDKSMVLHTMIRGKERYICQNDMVKVYRNLNKPAYFSVVALTGKFKNKVVAYGQSITLTNAFFKVSLASRQRALNNRTRCVHAWCIGQINNISNHIEVCDGREVTYQPFIRDDFHYIDNKKSVGNTRFLKAIMQGKNVSVHHRRTTL
ncbi:hypothetical protein [Thalassotalea piscium]|uniref:Uncharacterized protein n=1 Tax=Thalassotalea piscium TaxID=1230533 RepID=A0A7X0NGV5_9GAMM|nr:hypothetical protein [Thalassotalea piscium]MBB6543128.1 hypothetical protein [Thalassotalea piscium]